jgi:hypothetical protein
MKRYAAVAALVAAFMAPASCGGGAGASYDLQSLEKITCVELCWLLIEASFSPSRPALRR